MIMSENRMSNIALDAEKIPFYVVVIDDHPIIRLGAKLLLEKEGDFKVVGEAEDVKSGLQLVSRLKPNLVVLDLNLPDGSGFEVLSQIRSANQDSRVLIYTASTSRAAVIRSRFLGANGYLMKALDSDGILSVARAAMAANFIGCVSKDSFGHPFSLLSDREHEILRRLANGSSPGSIADELGISAKTVSSHKRNVLKRFDLNFVELLWLYSEFGGVDLP